MYDVYSLYISENELKKTTIMDATTRAQEVIDKLEQYKKIAGNAKVYVHGDCQDKDYDLTDIGWDPFKKKIVIKIWD